MSDLDEPTQIGDPPRSDPMIGRMINNNYKVLELISIGGMGEVYRGEGVLGDPVAIKIVLESLARDEKVLGLFKREARILSQLNVSSIVRYFNFVEDLDLGRYCLIMEYIDGIPLSDFVARHGALSIDQAKRLMHRLAAGLGEAHAHEVTHRDLSPDNVMLVGGDVDRAVLIDFGIAKSTQITDGTLHGQFAGKFKFISPEQLGHYDGKIDPRTDVYGLGLLIAAATRGEPLDMGGTVVDAVNARRAIPPLDGVPMALRPLIAHMLEPDPADRPNGMAAVRELIDQPARVPGKYAGFDHEKTQIIEHLPDTQLSAPRSSTVPPVGLAPAVLSPPTRIAPRVSRGADRSVPETAQPQKDGLGAVAVTLLLVGLGVGAWFVSGLDLRGGGLTQSNDEGGVSRPALDPPDTQTRTGFLADFQAEVGCTFPRRVRSGVNAGNLEVFAQNPGALPGLVAAYERRFDAAPARLDRLVAPAQCPSLTLLRDLSGRAEVAPSLTLDTDAVKSGGALAGRIRDVEGRSVWMFIVSAAGGVFNLSDRLQAQADGTFTFGLGLRLADGETPSGQVIVALASSEPLASVAAVSDGIEASELLPIVFAEIVASGGKAAADIAWFKLDE